MVDKSTHETTSTSSSIFNATCMLMAPRNFTSTFLTIVTSDELLVGVQNLINLTKRKSQT